MLYAKPRKSKKEAKKLIVTSFPLLCYRYTDYINSGVSIDAIEVVSSFYVETTTVPDALFSMTGLTSLKLVGSGVINGLAGQ